MKNKFVKQLGLLGIIGIVIKIIGALYRVPLGNFMTDDAVTYYAIAYPWYTSLIVISTAALPAVIAKLTAESGARDAYEEQLMVFSVSKKIMSLFGIGSLLFLMLGSSVIAKINGYPESTFSFYVLAIASYFVALNAAYRGFFQGTQKLEWFAISQLIEQIARVAMGLMAVAAMVVLTGVDAYVAAAATSGAAFGALASWLYSVAHYRKIHMTVKVKLSEHKTLIKKIVKMVIPIAMGASIMPILAIIDSTMIVTRLRYAGFGDHSGVMFTYVQFYSAPIINLAQVIFTALQVSLLPMVTRAYTIKHPKLNEKVYFGVLLSIGLGLPMGLGISAFSEQILLFLYPAKAESIVEATPVLAILGLGVVFLSIYQASTGILQGIDQYKKPVRNLFIGAVVKIIVGYVLLGMPAVNIKGAAISTLVAYAIAAILNVLVIFKSLPCPSRILRKSTGIIISNIIMIVSAKGIYAVSHPILGMRLSLLVSIAVAVGIYAVLIFKTGLINLKELQTFEEGDTPHV
jgi:stage V sporulation protein B